MRGITTYAGTTPPNMNTRLGSEPPRLHVLFLTAHDGLGADVGVHLTLARTLDRSKVRVSAATTLPEIQGASACEAFGSIPDVTHLPLDLGQSIGARGGINRVMALVHNMRGMVHLVSLAGWCRRNGVHVIHVTERPRQALFGLAVARMAGCACVIHAHTTYYPWDATRFATLRLRLADAVVGVSKFTAGTFERLAELPSTRVFAVHNSVDGELFRPERAEAGRSAMRQRLGIPADAPVIGCVARLMRGKDQESLLEAFAIVRTKVPQARLVLAGVSADMAPDGHGDYREYLIRRAHALGVADAVRLPGSLSQREMPQFYGALDVLAHPSLEEPFGLAVVEAMASRVPVIAVNGGGIPEIIRDGVDGLLVPAKTPDATALAITRLLGNPAFAGQLARSGRERVLEAFTQRAQADAMLKVYQAVVTQRGAHPAPRSGVFVGRQTHG